MNEQYYEPEADSQLMVEAIKNLDFEPKTALDVGLGSGILAKTVHENWSECKVTGIDVNEDSIKHCKAEYPWLEVVQSNLFENIDKQFDLLVCNPPYLPANKFDQDDVYTKALVGGKKGYEYIIKFLNQAKHYLNKGGKILLLFSNLSNKLHIDEQLHNSMYLVKQLAQKNVGMMEDLYIYELTLPNAIFDIEQPQFISKGKRGMIVKGECENKTVVLKIPLDQSDADRVINKESLMLQKVNKLGIGPRYIKHTKDYVMMEFVEGQTLKKFQKTTTKEQLTAVCDKVLKQCQALDQAGINKFEMTKPLKHIIINDQLEVTMLDYERALFTERPKNENQFREFMARTL